METSFHGSMKATLCGTLSSGGRRRRVKCSTISTASAQTRTVGGGLSSKPSSSSSSSSSVLAYLTIEVGMDRHGRNRALCAELLQRTPSNPLLVLHVPTEERSIKRRRRRRTFTAIAPPPSPPKKRDEILRRVREILQPPSSAPPPPPLCGVTDKVTNKVKESSPSVGRGDRGEQEGQNLDSSSSFDEATLDPRTDGRTDARYVIYLPSSSPLLPSSAVKKRSWQRIDPRASTSPFSCSQEKNHFGETPSPPPTGSVPTKKKRWGKTPPLVFSLQICSLAPL